MNPTPGNASNRRTFLLAPVAGLAILALRSQFADSAAMQSDSPISATATRQAELDELQAMRTALAASPVCDEPTPTATATLPPPVAAGEEAQMGPFVVTMKSISPMMAPTEITPQGQLLQINFSLRNPTATTLMMDFFNFTLESVDGVVVPYDTTLNNTLIGPDLALGFAGNSTTDLSMAFDFPDTSATSFIVANTSYPEFRAAVSIVERG